MKSGCRIVAALCASAAFVGATEAQAQVSQSAPSSVPGPPSGSQPVGGSSGQPAVGAAGGSDAQLNNAAIQTNAAPPATPDIIVTAQKREQRLTDVPLQVTVLGGDTLKKQGVSNITQLQFSAPELVFTGGPSPAYAIRGIGTQTYSKSAPSDVSIVVDGVIQSQPIPPQNGLFDVQRVEILSGPQGMLFGKNASAGVLNIVTNAPDPSKVTLAAHTDLGSRQGNFYEVFQSTLNVPVSDNSAFRFTGFTNHNGATLYNAYRKSDANSSTDFGGRLKYLWAPSGFKLNIIADYEKDTGNPPLSSSRIATTLSPLLLACGVTAGPENFNVCLDAPATKSVQNYGLSAQLDVSLGSFTLTSVTAERRNTYSGQLDSDLTSVNILDLNDANESGNQFTQELRLTSPGGGRLEYVLGLYYFNYLYKQHDRQGGGLGVSPAPILLDDFNGRIRQLSYAAFGQGTFKITDSLRAVFGARETRDITSATDTFPCVPSAGLCVPGLTSAGTSSNRVSATNFSYRVGAQYYLNRDNMVFVTYTRGYKGPALNQPATGNITVTSVNPEIPYYLEGGAKTSFFDRRLAINLTAFHSIVKNFQAQVFDQSVTPAVFRFANASKLVSNGAQFDVTVRPVPNLTLDGNVLYNHAVYGNFIVACGFGNCTGNFNDEGQQLANAPRWSSTLNGEYDHSLTGTLNAFANVNVLFQGKSNSLGQPDHNVDIPSHTIVNGRVGVARVDGKYGISLFVRNLFADHTPSRIYSDSVSGRGNYDQVFLPDSFRAIGLSLDLHL